MAYSENLAERIRRQLAGPRNVTEKKMFGGIGFLMNGNMCVGIWKNSLIARIGSERYAKSLKQEFVGPFDITGRAMKGWVLVAPEGVEKDDQLQKWIQQALTLVENLPAK